jgi:hypothetical protein
MENFGIIYGRWKYFAAIWYTRYTHSQVVILWSLGTFSILANCTMKKSGNPVSLLPSSVKEMAGAVWPFSRRAKNC